MILDEQFDADEILRDVDEIDSMKMKQRICVNSTSGPCMTRTPISMIWPVTSTAR